LSNRTYFHQNLYMPQKLVLAIAAVLLLVFQSCEKKEKDPRDKFVGTWKGLYTVKIDLLNISESDSVTVEIAKDTANPNQILIDDQEAVVTGDAYTYKEITDGDIDPVLGPVIVTLNGSGTLLGSTISETGQLKIKTATLNIAGTWSQNLKKQ
jgi:hypothetical protein